MVKSICKCPFFWRFVSANFLTPHTKIPEKTLFWRISVGVDSFSNSLPENCRKFQKSHFSAPDAIFTKNSSIMGPQNGSEISWGLKMRFWRPPVKFQKSTFRPKIHFWAQKTRFGSHPGRSGEDLGAGRAPGSLPGRDSHRFQAKNQRKYVQLARK